MREILPTLFCPASVAVVGASRNSEKLGSIVLSNLINSGFRGDIFPINPNAESIQDMRCYASVSDIGKIPELVVIAIPAKPAVSVIEDIAKLGVKNFVVLTAGFKEIGGEGVELEQSLSKLADSYSLNILGPNCLGFVNNVCPINATFSKEMSATGNLRFISQSGAIASSIFDWSASVDLGFNEFVTLGNKSDLTECDVLEYLYKRDQSSLFNDKHEGLSDVKPIGMYLESISDGTRFLNISKKVAANNPIFVIKPGKTQAAAKAMQSHTGSIAGEDIVFDALIADSGVTRCYTLEEFFDYAKAFSWEDAPKGSNVVVVSNAGGPAVISSDSLIENGLNLMGISESLQNKLKEVLPESASVKNPIDVLGDARADRYKATLEKVLEEDDVHAVLVLLTPQIMTEAEETARIIGELGKNYKKPIYCSFIGAGAVEQAAKILDTYKIPTFAYPERAIKAMAAAYKWFNWKSQYAQENDIESHVLEINKEEILTIVAEARSGNQKTLDNIQADRLLQTLGIDTPPTQYISTIEEALSFIQKENFPVVLKLSGSGLLHKRKLGGVITDIATEESLRNGFSSLEKAISELDGSPGDKVAIQIQKQVPSGVEVILGVKNDAVFGSILLFGSGGSYAELIRDVNILKLPTIPARIDSLIKGSKVSAMLSENYPLKKLSKLIYSFSKLPEICDDIIEAEINPVIVTTTDTWAVDGKVILKMSENTNKAPVVPSWGEATCTSHEVLASKFNFFEFEADKPIDFIAGQYVNVKVDDKNMRCYSVACHPEPTKFSLLVDTRPGGPGSQFFENIKPGETMKYLAPLGVFTLNDDDGSEAIAMCATGSGITAIRCMIEEALKEKHYTKPIKLYFGLTHNFELFWQDYFEGLKKQYPNFDYEYALCDPEEEWSGHKGFITELVGRDFPDASKLAVYMCGHPAMIDSVTEVVEKNGCPKERIYMERFV